MSILGNSRPMEGIVRRGMQQPIPDVAQPTPVAVPGLDVRPPVTSGVFDQVQGLVNAGVGLTLAGARFSALINERNQQAMNEQAQINANEARTFADAEAMARKTVEGLADEKAATDLPILIGQIDRGEIAPPPSLDAEAQLKWAKDIATAQSAGLGDIGEKRYAEQVNGRLLSALQGAVSRRIAEDRDVNMQKLSIRLANASSAEDFAATVGEATNLYKATPAEIGLLVGKAANNAAITGSDTYQSVFRPELSKPEFVLQRQALDLAWNEAKDKQAQEAIRLQYQQQRDIEIKNQRDVKALYDTVNSDLAGAAGDETNTFDTAMRWLGAVRGTMVRQPEKATELKTLENQLDGIKFGIEQRRLKKEEDSAHQTQLQTMIQRDVSAYAAGNALDVPDGSVKTRVELPDGTVSERSVPEYRKGVQAAALAKAPNLAEQVRMLENETPSHMFQPWQNLFFAGALAADSARFQTGTDKAQSDISPNTVKAVQLYTSIAAINPTLADAYAGSYADFYRDVNKNMRVAGVGANIEEAVQQVVLQRQNATGKALGLMDNEYKSIQSDYGTANAGEVASYINFETERQQRMLGKPKKDALEAAKESAKSQFLTINGYSTRTYNMQLPPGPYGSADKTFSAVVNDVAKRNNVDAKNLAVRINPTDGSVILWDFKTGMPSTAVPIDDRVFTVDEMYKRAGKIRLNSIANDSYIDLKGGTFRLEGLAL